MKRLIPLYLLALTTIATLHTLHTSPLPPLPRAIASTPVPTPAATPSPQPQRDVFYMSDRFGFRFVRPQNYVVEDATANTIGTSSDTSSSTSPRPLQVLELWQQIDYLNRIYVTESPPLITLKIYDNPTRLPLDRWKVELSRNDDRSTTVAGRPAIAYSATGLYESDNVVFSSPDNRYILQFQAGYMDAAAPSRQVFQDLLSSFTFDIQMTQTGRRINYEPLQRLLAEKNWVAADIETRALVYRMAGRRDFLHSSKNLFTGVPCEGLRTIDRLWSDASGGQLGYSAQQRIWQQVSAETSHSRRRVDRFAETVGWRSATPLPSQELRQSLGQSHWRLNTELNTAQPLPGQYPWGGISVSQLTDILSESAFGCGSCTTDAMYLSGDRFYDYLPAFFDRLQACSSG